MNNRVRANLIYTPDAKLAAFLRSILVRAGHWSLAASTEADALKTLTEGTVDVPLVVMDVVDPKNRRPIHVLLDTKFPATGFVYLSQSATAEEWRALSESNYWPVMPKSFSPGEFLQTVETVLRSRAPAVGSANIGNDAVVLRRYPELVPAYEMPSGDARSLLGEGIPAI